MKRLICAVLCGASVIAACAQDELVRLKMQTRVDYQREYVDGDAVHDNSGFKGKYFMLLLDGKINDHFLMLTASVSTKDAPARAFSTPPTGPT